MSLTATKDENKILIQVYISNPVPEIRNVIVKLNLGLAWKAAHEFSKAYSDVSYSDLEQEANIALIKSIDMFNPEGGAAFSNYVLTYIRGHLKHYIRDKKNIIRIPQKLISLHGSITKLKAQNNSLSDCQLAKELGVSEDKIREATKLKRVVPLELEEEPIDKPSIYQEERKQLPLIEIEELIKQGLKDQELWNAINVITNT
jgi:RNA polymerase sigma factor (sigma-70 family)